MATALLPGITLAGIMYDAGFSRDAIVLRLTNRVYMAVVGGTPLTELEAIAVYEAVAESSS
jgi:hypothetical protein